MDFDQDRRKRLVDLYQELDLEMGALVCCNNFLEANHVLVYNTEKEIMYTKACIDFAVDIGSDMVRVMASLWGYFSNPYASDGYGLPAFESRSRRVSRGEDYIEAWHQVREALTEVAKCGRQGRHPGAANPSGNHQQQRRHARHAGRGRRGQPEGRRGPALDGRLLAGGCAGDRVEDGRRDGVFAHHCPGDHPHHRRRSYGWEEVTPGTPHDPLPWETFVQACKDIGYDGLFSHEQCSPIVVKGHQLGTLATIDERYVESRNYFRKLFKKLGVYTGNKPEYVEYNPEQLGQLPELTPAD